MQDYSGFQVGASVIVPDIERHRNKEIQDLLKAINNHAVAVGIRIHASNTKVMPTLMPSEQHQAVLLDGEPLGEANEIEHFGSMCIPNDQRTYKSRSRIDLSRSTFSRLQSCIRTQCEISLRTKCRVTQAVVCSILPYEYATLRSVTMTASVRFYY